MSSSWPTDWFAACNQGLSPRCCAARTKLPSIVRSGTPRLGSGPAASVLGQRRDGQRATAGREVSDSASSASSDLLSSPPAFGSFGVSCVAVGKAQRLSGNQLLSRLSTRPSLTELPFGPAVLQAHHGREPRYRQTKGSGDSGCGADHRPRSNDHGIADQRSDETASQRTSGRQPPPATRARLLSARSPRTLRHCSAGVISSSHAERSLHGAGLHNPPTLDDVTHVYAHIAGHPNRQLPVSEVLRAPQLAW
jgi:hypothetical protein